METQEIDGTKRPQLEAADFDPCYTGKNYTNLKFLIEIA